MSTIRLSDLDFDGEIFEFEDLLAQNRLDHLTYTTLTAMEEDASLEVNDSAIVNSGIFDVHEVIDVDNEEDMTDSDTIYYYNGAHYYGNNGGEAIGFETVNGFAVLSDKNTFVTPEMCGGVGDGQTDDTDAVLKAFNTGKPIRLTGVYNINQPVSYVGSLVLGPGKLVATAAMARVLHIASNVIKVVGVKIDANGYAAQCIYAIGDEFCEIQLCECMNTDNQLTDNVSCFGIYVVGYKTENIHDNWVHNINRTKTTPYAISSVGIDAKSDGTISIKNNVIDGVECTAQTTDCDGVFVSNSTGSSGVAVVEGNFIRNSTGRFVKTQIHKAHIKDNNCYLSKGSNMFFKCFDFQLGGGECSGNYVDLGDHIATSSHIIHVDYNTNDQRLITVKDNIFFNIGHMAGFFYMVGDVAGKLFAENNKVVTGFCSYLINYPASEYAHEITFDHNDISFSRVINPQSNTTDFRNLVLKITNHKSPNAPAQFCDIPIMCNNITIKNNDLRASIPVKNVTIDYSEMTQAEFYYNGNGQFLTNAPAALEDSDRFYIRVCQTTPKICQYYEFAHGHSGYIT